MARAWRDHPFATSRRSTPALDPPRARHRADRRATASRRSSASTKRSETASARSLPLFFGTLSTPRRRGPAPRQLPAAGRRPRRLPRLRADARRRRRLPRGRARPRPGGRARRRTPCTRPPALGYLPQPDTFDPSACWRRSRPRRVVPRARLRRLTPAYVTDLIDAAPARARPSSGRCAARRSAAGAPDPPHGGPHALHARRTARRRRLVAARQRVLGRRAAVHAAGRADARSGVTRIPSLTGRVRCAEMLAAALLRRRLLPGLLTATVAEVKQQTPLASCSDRLFERDRGRSIPERRRVLARRGYSIGLAFARALRRRQRLLRGRFQRREGRPSVRVSPRPLTLANGRHGRFKLSRSATARPAHRRRSPGRQLGATYTIQARAVGNQRTERPHPGQDGQRGDQAGTALRPPRARRPRAPRRTGRGSARRPPRAAARRSGACPRPRAPCPRRAAPGSGASGWPGRCPARTSRRRIRPGRRRADDRHAHGSLSAAITSASCISSLGVGWTPRSTQTDAHRSNRATVRGRVSRFIEISFSSPASPPTIGWGAMFPIADSAIKYVYSVPPE